jgi:hypothetical protein
LKLHFTSLHAGPSSTLLRFTQQAIITSLSHYFISSARTSKISSVSIFPVTHARSLNRQHFPKNPTPTTAKFLGKSQLGSRSKPYRLYIPSDIPPQSFPPSALFDMDLTPQSSRSPASPYLYPVDSQPLYEYPSPALSSQYLLEDTFEGLGIFRCDMSEATLNVEEAGSASNAPSPHAENGWQTTVQHRPTPKSSVSTPNLLSVEFDSFSSYQSSTAVYSHDVYSSRTVESSLLPASPAPSANESHRSSFSSAAPSEIFSQAGSTHTFTPRIKLEEPSEYASNSSPLMMSSAELSHRMLVSTAGSYPDIEPAFYDQPSMGWPKVEYGNQELPSISSLPIPQYGRHSEGRDSRSHSQRRSPSAIARIRQPRKLTTKEDANFQCHIKGCGKLFGRSYNYKAHMETHDSSREYPFPCTLKDCNKKFVRKTDLQRHHQSVHMKQRNHRCDYCSRLFARKDTLRRHDSPTLLLEINIDSQ